MRGDIMEVLYLFLINLFVMIVGMGWLIHYFHNVFNAQADLIDKIIKNSNILFGNSDKVVEEIPEELFDDGRTHLLGGVIDMGTHNEGVCHVDCWCNDSEE